MVGCSGEMYSMISYIHHITATSEVQHDIVVSGQRLITKIHVVVKQDKIFWNKFSQPLY